MDYFRQQLTAPSAIRLAWWHVAVSRCQWLGWFSATQCSMLQACCSPGAAQRAHLPARCRRRRGAHPAGQPACSGAPWRSRPRRAMHGAQSPIAQCRTQLASPISVDGVGEGGGGGGAAGWAARRAASAGATVPAVQGTLANSAGSWRVCALLRSYSRVFACVRGRGGGPATRSRQACSRSVRQRHPQCNAHDGMHHGHGHVLPSPPCLSCSNDRRTKHAQPPGIPYYHYYYKAYGSSSNVRACRPWALSCGRQARAKSSVSTMAHPWGGKQPECPKARSRKGTSKLRGGGRAGGRAGLR